MREWAEALFSYLMIEIGVVGFVISCLLLDIGLQLRSIGKGE